MFLQNYEQVVRVILWEKNSEALYANFADRRNSEGGACYSMAGAEGVEPSIKVLETCVIPFHHAPTQTHGSFATLLQTR